MNFSHIIIFLAGSATGHLLTTCSHTAPVPAKIEHHVDTITRRDTIIISIPEPKTAQILRTDTIRVFSPQMRDSVTAALPITQVHYSDSTTEAWISGYRPQLDSLHVFPTYRTITRTVDRTIAPLPAKQKRWHLGITAGATATASAFRQVFLSVLLTLLSASEAIRA